MKNLFLSILVLCPGVLFSQNVHWGGVLNITFNDAIYDLQADNENSLIICGQYSGTVDFDPGPGVANMVAAGTSGEDIFLAKYDSAGNYMWSHGFGTGFFNDECDRVAVDSSGNIFITGMWNGTIDFDPDSVLVYNLSSNNNSRSRFLAKYDPDGIFLAAKNVGNAVGYLPSSQDGQSGLGCDADGNVYMGGFYGTSMTLGPGVTLSASGLSDNYFAKYSPQLDLIWAHRLGSNGTEYSQGLYVHPSGKLVVLGSFNNTIDFDPDTGVYLMSQVSSTQEGYFACYDSSGAFVFARQLSAGTSATPIACLFDSNMNLIVSGSCAGTMDADPGPGSDSVGIGYNDQAFVAAYDSMGIHRWAFAFGDVNSYNAIRYIGVDTANNIYANGNCNPMMDIDPGPDSVTFGNIYADYISKFDTAGNFLSAFPLQEAKMRIKNNDIFLADYFYGYVDFDPGPATYYLQSDTANASFYLLRLHQCDNVAATPIGLTVPPACAGDTIIVSVQGGTQFLWQFTSGLIPVGPVTGNTVQLAIDSSATLESVLVGSVGGCQNSPLAYVTFNVNLAAVPQVFQTGDTLFTNAIAVSYQWYVAGNLIPGADSSIYEPLSSGLYSVMITDSNGCSATSALFNFILIGVAEPAGLSLNIYPNPFHNAFVISFAEIKDDAVLIISDIVGREMERKKITSNLNVIESEHFAPGVYTLKIENEEGVVYRKIIKR